MTTARQILGFSIQAGRWKEHFSILNYEPWLSWSCTCWRLDSTRNKSKYWGLVCSMGGASHENESGELFNVGF